MIRLRYGLFVGLVVLASTMFIGPAEAATTNSPGNRLVYLDEDNPFYPGLSFPKLTTPQWLGETGVQAVVILAIDDMRDTPKYEQMLRPILERLKKIDGRAPVSIMCNTLAVTNNQLQEWLKEGLSLDAHTLTHPCPLLANGNFSAAAETYHACIDLLNRIPGNKPLAFRMPCCDSMNSPSPRFYAEMFPRATPSGHFLTIDSSVMNIITSRDASLPRELVLDADGRERFRKYLPAETNATTRVSMKSFVTTIEDYPYPYVINRLCWQFPAMAPSDWEARNVQGDNNPKTVEDWKAALDATVIKQGAFTFIFHPHGWIKPEQMVEFVDYAVSKHGGKVKFLNFREAQERLDKHLLAGNPLRGPDGQDNGVRILDLNADGYVDVVIGNKQSRRTRLWDPRRGAWTDSDFPTDAKTARFGIVDGIVVALQSELVGQDSVEPRAWRFHGEKWQEVKSLTRGLSIDGKPVLTAQQGRDGGVRFRDADNDGQCELIVGNQTQNAVFLWDGAWKKTGYALPQGTALIDDDGLDAGLRFVDVNGDGFDDVLFSNAKRFSLHQFIAKANQRLNWAVGWNDEVFSGMRGGSTPTQVSGQAESRPTDKAESRATESSFEVPAIVTDNQHRNNGVWFHSGHMWVQNEHTAHLPDKVDRRSFRQLLTANQPGPKSPQESLAAIKVRPGFTVELVAAEPLVADPIAFEWGADGRLWVVEMHDYPLGVDGKGQPGGRVRFLTDTNSDGHYDHSTIFLDGLHVPTGIYPWSKGVIIAAAPDIFYAEDSKGDGKADVRRTLFTGFTRGNPQHLLNGFDYGLDGWLYGANGDSGGSIRAASSSDKKAIDIRGHDFRFQPGGAIGTSRPTFEAIEGQTQYGRHRDDWGNWFGNNNPTWLWHYFLPERYLARNPQLAVKTTRQVLANDPEGTRCYPISRMMQRFNDHWQANHVTSGNSPTPYRDNLFGPEFATSVFIAEPVHNLVHREVLESDGVSFKSHRAADEKTSEFLASTDNWFRPTMLKTGPDGALYIADMYRLVIEHPEWITKDIQQRLDLRAGSDQGRIYRVHLADKKLRKIPRLDQLDAAGLVAALDHPNGWQRDTAQRLLVERNDRAAIAPLKALLRNCNEPVARLHAMCTLSLLGALDLEDLRVAWKDPHPGIREHSVRLSEGFADEIEKDTRDFERLYNDPDIRVRYQLAFSLGEMGPKAARGLSALGNSDVAGIRTAVLSSAPKHILTLLTDLFEKSGKPESSFVTDLVKLAGAEGKEETVFNLLAAHPSKPEEFKFAAVAGLLDALQQRRKPIGLQSGNDGALPSNVLAEIVGAAGRAAGSADGPEATRLLAIRVLGFAARHSETNLLQLGDLLPPHVNPDIQRAALSQLSRQTDRRAAEILIKQWPRSSPARRAEILNALLGRGPWTELLLASMEEGAIPAAEIGAAHQQKLLDHSETAVRTRAEKLFAARRADRKALLREYAEVAKLSLDGDTGRGSASFRQHCATCHKFKGEGVELGPEMGALAGKTAETLLVAILDPNQAMEARYASYFATTKDGRELSGIISSENANSITLRAAGGVDETILRSQLEDFKSTGLSLMPEGLESALPPQAMADLIAYILAP